MVILIKICEFCKRKYKPVLKKGHYKRQKYCSIKCREYSWIKSNPERSKELKRNWRMKKPLLCKGCKNVIDINYRSSGRTYCSDNCLQIASKENGKNHRLNRRIMVFKMLGGLKCVYCGCDEYKALEINHRLGGGCREYKNGMGGQLVTDLFYKKKSLKDFEVTCRVCNAWHYISKKINKDNWIIKWKKSKK